MNETRRYQYPFGEYVHPCIQKDQSRKEVFALGDYASAVHARWVKDGQIICQALAVVNEPEIFRDGNTKEAEAIIGRIRIPSKLGKLVPAGSS